MNSSCPKLLPPPISSNSSSISLQFESNQYGELNNRINNHLYDIIGGQGIIMESISFEDDKKKKEEIYQAQLIHMEEMFNYQERRRAALKASGSSMSPSQERESQETLQHQQEQRERRRNSTPTLVTTPRPSTSSSSGSNSNSSRPSTATTTTSTRRQSDSVPSSTSSLQARRSSANSSSSKFALSQEPNSSTQYLPLPIAGATNHMFQLKPQAYNNNQFVPPPPQSNYIPSSSSNSSSDITNSNHRRTLSNQSQVYSPSTTQFPLPTQMNTRPQPQKFEFKLPQAYPSPQAQTIQLHQQSSVASPLPNNYSTSSNYIESPTSTNLNLFGTLNSNSQGNSNSSNYLKESFDSKRDSSLMNLSNVPYHNINYDPLALNFQQSNEIRAQNELYDNLLGSHNNDSITHFNTNSNSTYPLPLPITIKSNQPQPQSQTHSSFPILNQPSPTQSQFINYPSPTNSIIDRRGSINSNSNYNSIPRVEEQLQQQGNYGFNYDHNLNRGVGGGGENNSMMRTLDKNSLVVGVDEFGQVQIQNSNLDFERSSKRRKEF